MAVKRLLSEGSDIYQYNWWDDFTPSHEEVESMKAKIIKDCENGSNYDVCAYNEAWDKFYKNHSTNFYRDRKWIKKDYPWIFDQSLEILELGCGVGNSISQFNKESSVKGCDFSAVAIDLARKSYPNFEFKCLDLVHDELDSCDIAMSVFTISSIDPLNHEGVFRNIYNALKKGGKLIFRDFGIYDYRQMKYKNQQCVKTNFYRRGDGTFAYFFDKDDLRTLLEKIGFKTLELEEVKSLNLNRKTGFKMFRVIIKGLFQK